VQLNRAWIEEHIPHQGRMCLLDEVIDWDSEHIRCRTNTHRALDNPLRSHDRLGIACGIEYAAQAMALHGALKSRTAPELGFLASVRDVRLFALRLDDIESDLICTVSLLAGDDFTALYEFAMREDRGILLTGRASVVLDAGKHVKYE
jgi:predicted hotdog family 3-hydroxylacyl-ACP dehydratase